MHEGKGKPYGERGKGKAGDPKGKWENGGNDTFAPFPLGKQTARTHTQTKRNDFPVGLPPQPPIYIYIYIYGRISFELLSHRAAGLRFLVRWLAESS